MEQLTIHEILQRQRALQELNQVRWGGLSPEKGRSSLLWAIGELCEAADVIKKEGDEAIMDDADIREHFAEEVADALMYLGDLLLCYDIDADTFTEIYLRKCKRNRTRWEKDITIEEGA
ncbi:MAG TPA: nucleotide pyrophosphohydrolase [Clostridiales bacterium]|jgi:NTP pyrophosphatase (non-canonical NTP hydrolase)|nr:nucleotide pyrophosphohydrolase [Clostridiales bacterium]